MITWRLTGVKPLWTSRFKIAPRVNFQFSVISLKVSEKRDYHRRWLTYYSEKSRAMESSGPFRAHISIKTLGVAQQVKGPILVLLGCCNSIIGKCNSRAWRLRLSNLYGRRKPVFVTCTRWPPTGKGQGGTCPPLENVKWKMYSTSIATFLFAQKEPKSLPPNMFHWLKINAFATVLS